MPSNTDAAGPPAPRPAHYSAPQHMGLAEPNTLLPGLRRQLSREPAETADSPGICVDIRGRQQPVS